MYMHMVVVADVCLLLCSSGFEIRYLPLGMNVILIPANTAIILTVVLMVL